MKARAMRQWLLIVFNLAIASGLLSILLWRVDWDMLRTSVGQIHKSALAFSLLSFSTIVVLEVARLRIALTSFALSWGSLARLHIIGVFFGNLLPGQVGADLYKVMALRLLGKETLRALSLVLLLRFIGLGVLLAFALPSLLLYQLAHPLWLDKLLWLPQEATLSRSVLGGCLLLVVVIVAYSRLPSRVRGRIMALLLRAREALFVITLGQVIWLVGLSLFTVIARVLVFFLLTVSVGFPLKFVDALFIVSLTTGLMFLPISFAGLGIRESVITMLLVHHAVPYEQALLVALLGRSFFLLLSGVGGLWFIYETVRSPHGLTEQTNSIDAPNFPTR